MNPGQYNFNILKHVQPDGILNSLDDPSSIRRDDPKSVNVRHHIVYSGAQSSRQPSETKDTIQNESSGRDSRLLFFSSTAAILNCSSSKSKLAFICSMAESEMGSPSS
jgi:hypothetical protein